MPPAIVAATVPIKDRISAKIGPVANLLKIDVTKIVSGVYRVNVWTSARGGELGFIRIHRIARSFVAHVALDDTILFDDEV